MWNKAEFQNKTYNWFQVICSKKPYIGGKLKRKRKYHINIDQWLSLKGMGGAQGRIALIPKVKEKCMLILLFQKSTWALSVLMYIFNNNFFKLQNRGDSGWWSKWIDSNAKSRFKPLWKSNWVKRTKLLKKNTSQDPSFVSRSEHLNLWLT